MKYDFDKIIDRIETRSTKWLKFDNQNILPMWVADMDFQCPPEVIEAIKKRADQGIYGYTEDPITILGETAEDVKSQLEMIMKDIYHINLIGNKI